MLDLARPVGSYRQAQGGKICAEVANYTVGGDGEPDPDPAFNMADLAGPGKPKLFFPKNRPIIRPEHL